MSDGGSLRLARAKAASFACRVPLHMAAAAVDEIAGRLLEFELERAPHNQTPEAAAAAAEINARLNTYVSRASCVCAILDCIILVLVYR